MKGHDVQPLPRIRRTGIPHQDMRQGGTGLAWELGFAVRSPFDVPKQTTDGHSKPRL